MDKKIDKSIFLSVTSKFKKFSIRISELIRFSVKNLNIEFVEKDGLRRFVW